MCTNQVSLRDAFHRMNKLGLSLGLGDDGELPPLEEAGGGGSRR